MIRLSDLKQRIGKAAPCLICHCAYDEIRKANMEDIAYMMRPLAEAIWSDQPNTVKDKAKVNNQLAALVRTLPNNTSAKKAVIQKLIADIDLSIDADSPIMDLWLEFKNLIVEAT
jgi:hypothetical protein